ncbi:MAG: hypothetical protein WBQ86_14185 [Candidatus Binatus sp.]
MTESDFRILLATQPLDQVVQNHIFDGEVHFFRRNARHYELLRDHLVPRLNVASRTNLRVIGSAKLGFSLDPAAFPRAFSAKSDIDVIVVDEDLFDQIWFSVLRWHYGQPGRELVYRAREWMRHRRYELYWGSFDPAEISPVNVQDPARLKEIRDFSHSWFDAFQSLTRLTPFAGRTISGHLYRTWRHALLYQISGLAEIKATLRI